MGVNVWGWEEKWSKVDKKMAESGYKYTEKGLGGTREVVMGWKGYVTLWKLGEKWVPSEVPYQG
jgi:hypothetical protein